jgi:serine protease Do
VAAVMPGSAAARAGIRQGDVITSFNGEPVVDGNTLRNRVASTVPGTEVNLTLVRKGREQQVSIKLDEYRSR